MPSQTAYNYRYSPERCVSPIDPFSPYNIRQNVSMEPVSPLDPFTPFEIRQPARPALVRNMKPQRSEPFLPEDPSNFQQSQSFFPEGSWYQHTYEYPIQYKPLQNLPQKPFVSDRTRAIRLQNRIKLTEAAERRQRKKAEEVRLAKEAAEYQAREQHRLNEQFLRKQRAQADFLENAKAEGAHRPGAEYYIPAGPHHERYTRSSSRKSNKAGHSKSTGCTVM